MRRSQQRRSSNTLPYKPAIGSAIGGLSVLKTSSLPLPQSRDGRKRASSIPRPSVTPSTIRHPLSQRAQDHNGSVAATPMRSHSAQRSVTPQKNSTTPQKITPAIKPFPKETRNFNDKNYIKEMMTNIVNFLAESGYPDQTVSIKDMQKIDKQSFVNFFNFICQFVDRSYQLPARFSEDELIRFVKMVGYGGTLTKAALVSIGALHSTSQIIGLLSWMADLARILMSEDGDEDSRQMSLERQETDLAIAAYNAWISDVPFNYEGELMELCKRVYQIEDGAVEEIEHQIQVVVDEYKILERKGSQMEELRCEHVKLEEQIDELSSKKAEFQKRLEESVYEEETIKQKLEEIKQKTLSCQKEIADLKMAAKNCPLSASEARQMKAECAKLRSEIVTITEQRAEVAELFEKREVQIANVSSEGLKIARKLNVDVMDSGVVVAEDGDWERKLDDFLREKTEELPKIEAKILSVIETREQLSNRKSHLMMELKHIDMQKRRLDEELQAIRIERDELKQIFLDEKSNLEQALAASSTRSDATGKRLQLELDTLAKQIKEADLEVTKAENDIQQKIKAKNQQYVQYAQELKDVREKANNYYQRLVLAFHECRQATADGTLTASQVNLIPKPDF